MSLLPNAASAYRPSYSAALGSAAHLTYVFNFQTPFELQVGSSLKSVVGDDSALLVVVLNAFKYSRYMLIPVGNAIHVVLHDDVSARDMVQAYLQVWQGVAIMMYNSCVTERFQLFNAYFVAVRKDAAVQHLIACSDSTL